jgi:3-isopropylmalate/(R)-2-methylmalate dehydratase small subunit
MNRIQGKAFIFGDNINTDIIAPPQYMELSVPEAAKYAMSAIDPTFSERVRPGDIMVAGYNFGSGSSRETAPLSLRHLGVGAIVAKSFARIFYRNAINLGMLAIECQETDRIEAGAKLAIDLARGEIRNITKQESYRVAKLPPHLIELIELGGLVPFLKKLAANGELLY